MSKEGFGAGLTPAPSPLGLGVLKYQKLNDTILTLLRCSAGKI